MGQLLRRYGKEKARVLVVEDDTSTRKMLIRGVEQIGWTAVGAENGRVGLERMAEEVPDLILLDLMMPVMDGFAFLTSLRKTVAWQTIPVAILTGKDLTESEQGQLSEFVDAILSKGTYSSEVLLTQVCDLVRTYLRP